MSADYDVVIVGSGVSGALIAKQLGATGKKVLILEAGAATPDNLNDYLQTFFNSSAKVPESPYTPAFVMNQQTLQLVDPSTQNAPRPTTLALDKVVPKSETNPYIIDPKQSYLLQVGPMPFSSTSERINGGTMRHWLGTSLRFVPNDFTMRSTYGVFTDWPIDYSDLEDYYGRAEHEIGVSADKADQQYCGITYPADYQYPMRPIPDSLVDAAVTAAAPKVTVDGIVLEVTNTPAGRNSETTLDRPACAGNTNCIPICPIQAKYDPSVTIREALQYPNVTIQFQTVVTNINVNADKSIASLDYVTYQDQNGPKTGSGTVTASAYVIAAHAIETPKLLLMSKGPNAPAGVANSKGLVGKFLMDHPLYLAWALAPENQQLFGYRGPLSTGGIENCRDGSFRKDRAAFRIEIGNEGWNFATGDPNTTCIDWVIGTNMSHTNPPGESDVTPQALHGPALIQKLNSIYTRQFRLGFLVEQSPDETNTVTLDYNNPDRLGLPRPVINYDLSEYTRNGFAQAAETASQIFEAMGATEFTQPADEHDPTSFVVTVNGKERRIKFFGAGHTVGTYRMGTTAENSVVNADGLTWDHPNLYLVGSGTFPTVATGNPTLTIAALALRTADAIDRALSLVQA